MDSAAQIEDYVLGLGGLAVAKIWALMALCTVAGCSGSGLGMPGSPAWFATTPQAEQASYFRTRCVSYGFSPDTPAMAQCIQNESLSSRGRAAARSNAAFANMAASQPKTTTCNRFGNTVNCTTF